MASLLNMSGGSLLNKGLPYDYEVEYLESTGTQWIDTGVVPSASLRVVDCYQSTAPSNIAGRSGIQDRNIKFAWGDRETNTFCFLISDFWKNLNLKDYDKHVFDIKSGRQLVDNQQFDSEQFVSSESYYTKSLTLFAMFIVYKDNYEGQLCKRYYTKFYEGDNCVRDFIPVVDKQGVGCMYDKVSKQLFYNQGTGNFIVGPRVS